MNQKTSIQKIILQALACLLVLFMGGKYSYAQVEPLLLPNSTECNYQDSISTAGDQVGKVWTGEGVATI